MKLKENILSQNLRNIEIKSESPVLRNLTSPVQEKQVKDLKFLTLKIQKTDPLFFFGDLKFNFMFFIIFFLDSDLMCRGKEIRKRF